MFDSPPQLILIYRLMDSTCEVAHSVKGPTRFLGIKYPSFPRLWRFRGSLDITNQIYPGWCLGLYLWVHPYLDCLPSTTDFGENLTLVNFISYITYSPSFSWIFLGCTTWCARVFGAYNPQHSLYHGTHVVITR